MSRQGKELGDGAHDAFRLPVGAAYQFHAARPGVVLLQTLAGPDTIERWAEICQTTPRRTA